MNRRTALLGVFGAIAFAGCGGSSSTPKGGDGTAAVNRARELDAEAIAKINRGVGILGKFDYSPAVDAFQEVANQYPNHPLVKVNLAIALLNRDQNGEKALPILAEVLAADPNHLAARYCTGLLLVHAGKLQEALPHFQKVVEGDPNDAFAAYFYAQCLEVESSDKALEWYRKAAALDPYLKSAFYRTAQIARQRGNAEEAAEMLKAFSRLDNNPQARLVEMKYSRMGPKAEAVGVDESRPSAPARPDGPVFKDPVPLVADANVTWNTFADHRAASITACDIDGDGRLDLFIADAIVNHPQLHNAVIVGQADGTFKLDMDHPLAKVSAVRAALWGDVDNDGRHDVYLCRKGPNQLWRQVEANRWQDVTESTKTAGGDFDTVDGMLLDADHDADLDIFLVNANGPWELLNNNRDGSFRPLAKERGIAGDGRPGRTALVVDFDRDRDADVVLVHAAPPHALYANNRLWDYQPATGFKLLQSTEIAAIAPGDADADGQVEFYTLGPAGLQCWRQNDKGDWQATTLSTDITAAGKRAAQLAIQDVDGDGAADLITPKGDGWQAVRLADSRASSAAGVTPLFSAEVALAGWTLAVADPATGPVIVGMPPGKAPLLWPAGPGRHTFASFSLSGTEEQGKTRSNRSGVGTKTAVRFGSRWSVRLGVRSDSGPGQSLQPWTVGLGGADKADFVRLDWSDGVMQTELDVPAGKLTRITEHDRMPTSCPILFVWDGTCHRFVTDLLGVGGLGYFVEPSQYATPDPTENVLLPPGMLAPRDGRFVLKLVEPSEELTYLDSARLVSYDLPPGWKMTLDERLGLQPPLPTGRPVFFRTEFVPILAANQNGDDVTRAIAQPDFCAAPIPELDQRFVGRTEQEHVLTLTFAEPIDQSRGEPILVADGWVEFPYSQTLFAAWQANAKYAAPTIEAQTPDGRWVRLLAEFGYPGGMPRQMSVALPGLPAGVKSLRLRTNLQIYWDALRVVFAEPCPEARIQALPLVSAQVHDIGFVARQTLEQHRPEVDYDERWPIADARDPAGFYTRVGPMAEMVTETDGALAIFGPGEEVHFEFVAPSNEIAPQWSRWLVLETVGWCKDMDLYTHTGETVEPLPGRPADPAQASRRDELHRRYNVRYQSGYAGQ
jgi:Flp pilus assembly protein TadD